MQFSRAHRTTSILAAVLVTAATLTGCGDSSEQALPEPTVSDSAQDTESTTTASDAPETSAEDTQDNYTDVDPSRFEHNVVGLDSGVFGCRIGRNPDDTPVFCQAAFVDPIPPVEHNGGDPNTKVPNVIWYKPDRGGFITAVSPGSQGYDIQPSHLNEGERVTINNVVITNLNGGGVRVEYGNDAFEVHDGVYSRPGKTQSITEEHTVAKGEQCGTTDMFGMEMGVYALEDNTTCDVAMGTLEGYKEAAKNGELQGSVTAWTNKNNGWGCLGRYILDGDEDIPSNRRTVCTDTQMSGAKAYEGTGGVVLLDPSEAHRLKN
ncbi:hypothetical protein HMPREF3145_03205 [Corynebacterium sp. HMSC05C01]|uniref:hypothetical protein n=1 Tax=Corynebacterium sp. HMSC05C01 TaxID=1581113 RepID=UPI0008A4A469|nr:hypothetical protein [Corynebacterium sp. HMSC05C01]OFT71491.1 hypothetical protein HMPREF3145_03205 [Corynebacterium sp. HMSC05C01]